MEKKPSDIHSGNNKKLTRRRVMKLATAAGFSATTAATLTADDIRAADSDQVTISFDTEGNIKNQVPADWYDWVQRAKEVRQKIYSRHWGKDGIKSIGMSSGEGEDNPHIVVDLDQKNNKKEERRGEISEREDGIRIKIREKSNRFSADCDDQTASTSSLPGGVRSDRGGISCTNGPRFINGSFKDYDFGWSIAAHCLSDCSDGDFFDHDGVRFAEVVFVDFERDIAYLEPRNNAEPVSEIVYPEDHSQSAHISGTVSEDGISQLLTENSTIIIWGINGCETLGGINAYNQDRTIEDVAFICANYTLTDMLGIGTEFESPDGGDSGTVYFAQNPDGDKFFAVGSHAASTDSGIGGNYAVGGQGYSIRNEHNIWWDDL